MESDDIPQVTEIDREAFPGEWAFRSQSSYKHDLGNSSIRYIVASGKTESPDPDAQLTHKPPWFKRFFGHERGITTPEFILGFSGFWMMMREAHIIAIGVRESYRRLGIGEALLIATIDTAAIMNAGLVTLEVRASNETAQALYRKYGFKVTGRRLKYYSSDGEDAIIMSTESIISMPFQSSFQHLKKAHAQRYGEIPARVS